MIDILYYDHKSQCRVANNPTRLIVTNTAEDSLSETNMFEREIMLHITPLREYITKRQKYQELMFSTAYDIITISVITFLSVIVAAVRKSIRMNMGIRRQD